jgi:hypothetical protein
MSNEQQENPFKGATQQEVDDRKKTYSKSDEYREIVSKWKEEFQNREDISQNSDGSYDVNGDIISIYKKISSIPIKLNIVKGNLIWDGLEKLENFPKEVQGKIMLINSKVLRDDVRDICTCDGVRMGEVSLH